MKIETLMDNLEEVLEMAFSKSEKEEIKKKFIKIESDEN